jgi:homoserine kinase
LEVSVKVPATTANLGPGFDALGLALDLWNEATLSPADDLSLTIHGEGANSLPRHSHNLIIRAAQQLAERVRPAASLPPLHVDCINRIPPGAGLGSSAAAVLAGLLGANVLLGEPFTREEILQVAAELEGHPDNVAPALLGGLVVSTMDEGRVLAHRFVADTQTAPKGYASLLHVTVVIPDFNFPTREARAALPKMVPLTDAVYNIGRAVLVAEALRTGDLGLLGQAMDDSLHEPYRLALIPGARAAMEAAKRAGAAAVALSGAGPSLAAFSAKHDGQIGAAMQRAFADVGLAARILELGVSEIGAQLKCFG